MQLGFLFKKRQIKAKLQQVLNLPSSNVDISRAGINIMPSLLLAAESSFGAQSAGTGISSTREEKNKWFTNKRAKLLILILLLATAVTLGNRFLRARSKSGVLSQSQSSPYRKVMNINKSFTFPGFDNQGRTTTDRIKMAVTSAEKNTEVLVKDQTFTAKEGKLFLIINLELQNDSTNRLNIFPGDLIRLTAENSGKKFAPDLHNNVVLVAPISTKIDRVGFVIDLNAKNFKLLVGELEKPKTEVPLNF